MNFPMRVLHVIPGISRDSGGPSRSVQGLVAGLNELCCDASLLSLVPGEKPWVSGVTSFFNGIGIEQVISTKRPDIVHLHGIWDLRLHSCAVACRKNNIPYVIAPRGMLEPWSLKQKWLKKRIARFLYQDFDLKCAAALHATAESEAAHFKDLGFINRCVVSANAVNVPNRKLIHVNKKRSEYRRVLLVSRMHPKKGVMELVECWNVLRPAGWVCELVYTRNGHFEREYEMQVKKRVGQLGLSKSFIFTGPLDDEEKWKAYERGDIFVLPSYSENFGIVVAEALYAGLPVLTTKGTPWGNLESECCGRWVDVGGNQLLNALREMLILSEQQRSEMGMRGRMLVERKYTWRAVARTMMEGYQSIMKSGEGGQDCG